jgi:hypothetical protein
MKSVGIFLITVVLIVGMVGCGSTPLQYTLTITSTAGGSVTEPGEGTFTYDEGTIVDLVAEPDQGYIFVSWTGDVDTIANVDTPTSTITMNGDYSVTANFVLATPVMDWYDLCAIRDNLAGAYVLMNDLDSTTPGYEELAGAAANGGKGWEPIGASDSQFTGVLDGQGHEIRDLFVSRSDESYVGLFGYVAEGATIRDIGVTNVAVTGYDYVGSLVGRNDGTVVNSYSIGSVNGQKYVGGLVGYDLGHTVSNSYYDYEQSLINGENMITLAALSDEDFEEWLANGKFLDVNERLSQEDGYYLINDVNDFKQLLVFGQNSTLKFRLTNDLDLGDEPDFYIPYLAGEFDGNDHTISNLSVNLDFVSPLGLFARVANGATLTHIGVENVDIAGYQDVGGLVGEGLGTISDSYCAGSVTGYRYIGGLVGANIGTVINCYATGNVSGESGVGGVVGHNEGGIVSGGYFTGSVTSDSGQGVGGLVGENWRGTITNSRFVGDVGGDVNPEERVDWVGGLVGWNDGDVVACYSSGDITGFSQVGGLIGAHWDGIIDNCSFTGNVTGQQYTGGLVGMQLYGALSDSHSIANVNGYWFAGGLVGWNEAGAVNNCYSVTNVTGRDMAGGLIGHNQEGTIAHSYSCGTVSGGPDGNCIGGLVGRNYGTVSNSYSMSVVAGWDDTSSVGGLIGHNSEAGTVSNCYSTGNVIGEYYAGGLVASNRGTITTCYSMSSVTGIKYVGGLVGYSWGTVTDSFWDTETSGQSTSAGGTGKTTAEMKNIATFSGAGWNIVTVANLAIRNPSCIWNIVGDETYPFLSWQPVS